MGVLKSVIRIRIESRNQVGSVNLVPDPDPGRPEKRRRNFMFGKVWMDAYPWA
jgi:hypothetical protein